MKTTSQTRAWVLWTLVITYAGVHVLAASRSLELGEPPRSPQSPEELDARQGVGLAGPPPSGYAVNIADREAVRVFHNMVYMAAEGALPDWTGNAATCGAGTTSAAFKRLIATRINYFRAMAGVPAAITLDNVYSAKDQQAALMMAVNGLLDHNPPASWYCFSATGVEAARKSNLALDTSGPDAITGYINDPGSSNGPVGHRRWVLYPQTRVMGTGDIPLTGVNRSANATWIQDSQFFAPRPATRDNFVSWPPPGFVPYPVVFGRWSLSYPNADFSKAWVTMASNGVPVAVGMEVVTNGFAENTVVWYPSSINPWVSYAWPRPSLDTPYAINVSNVLLNGTATNFSYTVTVFDPSARLPNGVLATLSGPDQPALGQPNQYSLGGLPVMTGLQWAVGRRAPLAGTVEGAENGLNGWLANTSPGYLNVLNIKSLRTSGNFGYNLAHPVPSDTTAPPADQILTYQRVIVPLSAGAQVSFQSRLTYATRSQQAKVQISVDQGLNWFDVYSQAGTDDVNEINFNPRTASLAAYVGRPIQLRFNYHFEAGGLYFPHNGNDYIGWHLDEIKFLNTDELAGPVVATVGSDTNFTFTPAQTGEYLLAARAGYFGEFYGEWGPVKAVTAQTFAIPVVTLAGPPTLEAGQVKLEFLVTNHRPSLSYKLLRATSPVGPWVIDAGASFQAVQANARFRFTTPAAPSTTFFRVRTH